MEGVVDRCCALCEVCNTACVPNLQNGLARLFGPSGQGEMSMTSTTSDDGVVLLRRGAMSLDDSIVCTVLEPSSSRIT